MLSRLSRAALCAYQTATGQQAGDYVSPDRVDDAEVLYLNLEINDILTPLPSIAWSTVTHAYTRTVSPVYRVLRDSLENDMTQLAAIVEPEALSQATDMDTNEREAATASSGGCEQAAGLFAAERPPRKRRRSSISAVDGRTPLTIRGADPSLPTIVITPCPSRPREFACLVPVQDAQFGNRLTVPTHPAVNDTFPPLAAKPFPLVDHWRYEGGHWRALIPDAEEQMTRGIFSRPLPARRHKASVRRRPVHPASRPPSAM